jgi:hypothetical protein
VRRFPGRHHHRLPEGALHADHRRAGAGRPRGAYTGAFGWLNRDGDLDLNILIRTLWMRDNALHFRAGAGIVVDSVRNPNSQKRALKREVCCAPWVWPDAMIIGSMRRRNVRRVRRRGEQG